MTDSITFFPPASFFLRQIPGWQGRTISAMQAFVRGGSKWTHAGIVLDNREILQAEPGGAKIYSLDTLLDDRPMFVSDAPIQKALRGKLTPRRETALRAKVVANARSLVGTPYSFLDYPVLALAEWTEFHPHNPITANLTDWLRARVKASGHMICSALVDDVYLMSGIHLFDDDRLPGDVTPGDLDQYTADYRAQIITEFAETQRPKE